MSCSPPHPRARVSALPTGQSGASPEHYISGQGSHIFGRVTLRGDLTFFKLKFLIFNQIAGSGSRLESLPPSPWKHPQDSGSGPIEAAADGPLQRIHGEEGAGPKRALFLMMTALGAPREFVGASASNPWGQLETPTRMTIFVGVRCARVESGGAESSSQRFTATPTKRGGSDSRPPQAPSRIKYFSRSKRRKA